MNKDKLQRKKIPAEFNTFSYYTKDRMKDDPENSGRIEMLESLLHSITEMLTEADIDIKESTVKPVAYRQDDGGFKGIIKIDGYEITIRERNG